MPLLKKKPATVAEALAPFRKIQSGLAEVISSAARRKREAQQLTAAAARRAAAVKKSGDAVISAADAEEAEARRVLEALAAITGGQKPGAGHGGE